MAKKQSNDRGSLSKHNKNFPQNNRLSHYLFEEILQNKHFIKIHDQKFHLNKKMKILQFVQKREETKKVDFPEF